MNVNCEVIRDLLPLYAEDIASDSSRQLVETHLEECNGCRAMYEDMTTIQPEVKFTKEPAESFQKFVKKKKRSFGWKVAIITTALVSGAFLAWIFKIWVVIGFVMFDVVTARVQVDTDISNYDCYMGELAEEEYRHKWGMDQTIFPSEITNPQDVLEYKMVYYNPWDAQYLSYLTIEYDDRSYEAERSRLQAYDSTEYLGYYSVTGFSEETELLAMYADSYYGFVYAITTPERENTITYVEIIFCNYYLEFEYEEYMPAEYFPEHFDATEGNPYQKKMAEE